MMLFVMKSVELFIKGRNLDNAGYRSFLLLKASEHGIPRIFAFNSKLDGIEMVVVRLQAEDDIVTKYIDFLITNYPDQLEVQGIIEREFNGHVVYASDFAQILQLELITKAVSALRNIEKQKDSIVEKEDLTFTILKSLNI